MTLPDIFAAYMIAYRYSMTIQYIPNPSVLELVFALKPKITAIYISFSGDWKWTWIIWEQKTLSTLTSWIYGYSNWQKVDVHLSKLKSGGTFDSLDIGGICRKWRRLKPYISLTKTKIDLHIMKFITVCIALSLKVNFVYRIAYMTSKHSCRSTYIKYKFNLWIFIHFDPGCYAELIYLFTGIDMCAVQGTTQPSCNI